MLDMEPVPRASEMFRWESRNEIQYSNPKHRIPNKSKIHITTFDHLKLFGIWYLAFGIFLSNGCVYYNTFYNAKQSYADALREIESSPSEIVSPRVKKLLEITIQKCEKIVTYHPKSKWVDDAIFLMSKSFYWMGEYENALRKIDELEIYFPDSPFLEEALFLRGRISLQQKNYTAAIAAFEGLRRVSKKYDNDAQLEILNVYYKKGEYEEVVERGRVFITSASGGKESRSRREALLKVGKALFELARYGESLQAFQDLLQEDPPKEMVFEAMLKIGDSYLTLQDPTRALETFLALKTSDLTPQEEALWNLRIARSQRLMREYEKGIETLQKVSEIHPRSEEAAEAYYMMGLIYQEDLEDLEKARKSYEKVREMNPQAEVAEDALVRSTAIGKLTEYRERLSGGEEEALAETQFLLAELYLLELKKTDEALKTYEKVIQDFPESEYAPRSFFAIAWIFHHLEGDTVKAVEGYERIIVTYPDTRYSTASRKAIEKLNQSSLHQPPEADQTPKE